VLLCRPDPSGDAALGGIAETLGMHKNDLGPGKTIVSMRTLSVGDLFKKYHVPKTVTYWSLDTEGSEYQLLEAFPWDTHQVLIFTIGAPVIFHFIFHD